jgi:hypothetical protein
VPYDFYTDAGHTTLLAIDGTITLPTSTGVAQTVNLYGQARGKAGLPAGVYTDTVAVELSVLSHAGAWRLPAVGLGLLLAQGALAATGSTFHGERADRRRLPGGRRGDHLRRAGLRHQFGAVHGHLSTSLGGTTVTFQCTPGVAMSMSLDGGQNSASGTAT